MPEQKDQIQEIFESLKNELLESDNNIQRIVSTDQDKPLLASHPVYQYLAKRYSLNLKSMHWEPDKMPSIDQWQKLINILETHPSKWMIWENTPINDTKERLESLGISSIVFNPSGNAPEKGDYMSVMYQNVENLSIVFEQVPEKSSP
ncbi:metal ABC transporter substrate-binding protein [Desulfobacterota bacterium AH_259_B03_O07]|nr:metal ABC transporter substrate-binding protein [Desulfobacterota bacterium AH_259_B03_O07]